MKWTPKQKIKIVNDYGSMDIKQKRAFRKRSGLSPVQLSQWKLAVKHNLHNEIPKPKPPKGIQEIYKLRHQVWKLTNLLSKLLIDREMGKLKA